MTPSGESQTVGQFSGAIPVALPATDLVSFSFILFFDKAEARDFSTEKMLSRVGEDDSYGAFKSTVLLMSFSLFACFYFSLCMSPLVPWIFRVRKLVASRWF